MLRWRHKQLQGNCVASGVNEKAMWLLKSAGLVYLLVLECLHVLLVCYDCLKAGFERQQLITARDFGWIGMNKTLKLKPIQLKPHDITFTRPAFYHREIQFPNAYTSSTWAINQHIHKLRFLTCERNSVCRKTKRTFNGYYKFFLIKIKLFK